MREWVSVGLVAVVVLCASVLCGIDKLDPKTLTTILGAALVVAHRTLTGEKPGDKPAGTGTGTGAGPVAGMAIGAIGGMFLFE